MSACLDPLSNASFTGVDNNSGDAVGTGKKWGWQVASLAVRIETIRRTYRTSF